MCPKSAMHRCGGTSIFTIMEGFPIPNVVANSPYRVSCALLLKAHRRKKKVIASCSLSSGKRHHIHVAQGMSGIDPSGVPRALIA